MESFWLFLGFHLLSVQEITSFSGGMRGICCSKVQFFKECIRNVEVASDNLKGQNPAKITTAATADSPTRNLLTRRLSFRLIEVHTDIATSLCQNIST